MRAWTITASALAAGLCIALFAAAANAAESSYIADAGEATRAVDEIIAQTGRSPRLQAIELTDRRITVDLQGKRSADIDEWQIGRVTRLFMEFETTVGPRASSSPGLVNDVESGFFDRKAIDLDIVPDIAARAVTYADLDDEAHVQSIEISRDVTILPQPAYGDVRWSIYVTSGRESATIRADAAGKITGGDLANTNRARNMDLLADANWPQKQAMDALMAAIGGDRRLRDLTVRPRALSVAADHPTVAGRKEDYSWTISGVTRSPLLSPLVHGASAEELFSLSDVDLSSLAKIRNTAKREWGNDKARLEYMTLKRVAELPGGPEMRWIVYFNDLDAEGGIAASAGSIEITPDGEVRKVNRPPSHASEADWLDPGMVAATFERLSQEFGTGARFAEITFDREKARILAEDPDREEAMAEFVAGPAQMSRSDRLMPWDAEFRAERLFPLDALGAFTRSEKLAGFKKRAYALLGIDEKSMPLSRYTFAIGQTMGPDGSFRVPSPDGRPTLEVRVESADGQKIGRVTFASDGREIDVAAP